MRRVIYAMSVSLDGYIEAADGDLSWAYPDEELHRHFNYREDGIDTYLYGRRLYENMAAHWPAAEQDPAAPAHEIEYARIWKDKPKVVFSRTLDRVHFNARLHKGDIAAAVQELKGQSGKDLTVGGAELAASFIELGLVDEYQLYLHPVILGGGKPMFRRPPDRLRLELVEARTFGSGVVMLRYRRAP